jgi:Leucine-rich repeat (LRR) protein
VHLFSYSCSLTSLPPDLAELKNLKVLKLNYNNFDEFPKVVCGLHKLQAS